MQVEEEQGELVDIVCVQVGELGTEQLFEVVLCDGGHLDDHKAGRQRLVQLTGARIAVVHGGDEAGLLGQRDALVAGHVDGAAEVQHGVEDGQRLVFGHVDLVQHTKPAALGAAVDRAGPEFDRAALKRIHADEGGCVHVHMERDVPRRAAEGGGEVLGQHIFAGGLAACQQQVLAAEQRGQSLLPDVLAIISKGRHRDAGAQRLGQRVGCAVFFHSGEQCGIDALLPQGLKQIRHERHLLHGLAVPNRFFSLIIAQPPPFV